MSSLLLLFARMKSNDHYPLSVHFMPVNLTDPKPPSHIPMEHTVVLQSDYPTSCLIYTRAYSWGEQNILPDPMVWPGLALFRAIIRRTQGMKDTIP